MNKNKFYRYGTRVFGMDSSEIIRQYFMSDKEFINHQNEFLRIHRPRLKRKDISELSIIRAQILLFLREHEDRVRFKLL